jgi:hypothetical protein
VTDAVRIGRRSLGIHVNEAIESVLDGTAPSPRLIFRMSPDGEGISTDEHYGGAASDVRADTAVAGALQVETGPKRTTSVRR